MNPPVSPAVRWPRPDNGPVAGGQAQAPALPVIDSDALLCGLSTVVIAHRGQHYRLQTTRQGKLILTK